MEDGQCLKEKVISMYRTLATVLKSDEYLEDLRFELEHSNPNYLIGLQKRIKDMEKSDHGIVVAGTVGFFFLKSNTILTIFTKKRSDYLLICTLKLLDIIDINITKYITMGRSANVTRWQFCIYNKNMYPLRTKLTNKTNEHMNFFTCKMIKIDNLGAHYLEIPYTG